MPAQVKIYTTRTCPYCHAAERLLRDKRVAFEQIDVTGDRATRDWLEEQTGQGTVPQILINGKSLGGYSDLSALDGRGELDTLLAADPPASA